MGPLQCVVRQQSARLVGIPTHHCDRIEASQETGRGDPGRMVEDLVARLTTPGAELGAASTGSRLERMRVVLGEVRNSRCVVLHAGVGSRHD